ncbi:type II secretion system F family protein [Corynebacterium sp. UBA2622]|uniref:type II secretion system F family protein n=1 Tax=Corynebacterium sp. UBA2622 TaxID=1946393 RepID=UPI0025C15192|nr:type II secretion system F family protein [Corynebacterium sp. UBA2622]
MSTLVPAIFTAAALCVPVAGPGGRVSPPKSPRDGPVPHRFPASRAHTALKVESHRVASDLDLFAACFRAGLPAASAAAAVAESYDGDDGEVPGMWRTAAALTVLGAEPERAWAHMHRLPGGAELAALVALSGTSGAAVAVGCERIAAGLREDASDVATARAERAGVLIAIPLTAFFLPAFFVLGLAPVVIGLAGTLT